MKHDVFISYTQPDRNVAFRIHEMFQVAGLRSWIAVSSSNGIAAGRGFEAEIVAAIKASEVFVLVYSHFCNKSDNIIREVRQRRTDQPTIILRLDRSPFGDGLSYYLTGLQHIDLLGEENAALGRLVSTVRLYAQGRGDVPGGGAGPMGGGAGSRADAPGGWGTEPVGAATGDRGAADVGAGTADARGEAGSTDRMLFLAGMKLLRQKRYQEAAKSLQQHAEIAPDDPHTAFYWALAVIGGRETRQLDGLLVKKIDQRLQPFIGEGNGDIGGGKVPFGDGDAGIGSGGARAGGGNGSIGKGRARIGSGNARAGFINVLLAIVKRGYYTLNGFKVPPPSVEELMDEVTLDSGKADDLLVHLDEPENDVWRLVASTFSRH